jgi:hypothetical protein
MFLAGAKSQLTCKWLEIEKNSMCKNSEKLGLNFELLVSFEVCDAP